MLFQSPSRDVRLPESAWPDYFLDQLGEFADLPALVDAHSGRVITYAELKQHILQCAASLQQNGYEKGDVIAMYTPNCLEFVICFQAVLAIGGIVTPVNPMYTADELSHQLNHAHAVALLTSSELYAKVVHSLSSTTVRETILLDDTVSGGDNVTPLAEYLEQVDSASFQAVSIEPADLAVLPFSSGTTGLSKGVMLSHANLVSHNAILAEQKDTSLPCSSDRVIATLPFFHIYGASIIMNLGLTQGAPLIVLSAFEPNLFLHTLEQHCVTRAYLVPPILLFLAKSPEIDNYDLHSLEYICSGAAPLGEEIAEQVQRRLSCRVVQAYGMTEMSPATHFTPDLSDISKPASIGVLIPNTEAQLIDTETGAALGCNQTGELLVRGPQMMLGYLNNAEATSDTIDEEGWLHTGDIAYADEDGYFYIVDRLKEFIKYKGYQVAPAELEAALLAHPDISDVAVVPFPDEEAGEIPKAFVVTDADIQGEDIMNWLAGKVAPFKKVRAVEFIDQIPKSPSGKILRRLLKA